jgi:hypothetical protein
MRAARRDPQCPGDSDIDLLSDGKIIAEYDAIRIRPSAVDKPED